MLSLDDPAARDPLVVGAKAAWLAEGRLAGLPVLPGFVLPAKAGHAAMEAGAAALPARGSGGARLVVAGLPLADALAAALATVGDRLGDRLVVRSSSRLEAGGEWAGAFTSYTDLPASDLPTAVRGCWASAFGVDALRRFEAAGVAPVAAGMAVLIQPYVDADAGGAARLDASGEVEVVGVRGAPVAVLQGWEPGVVARIATDGSVVGDEALRVLGAETVPLVGAAVREAADRTGATAVEWALVDGRVVLLQLGRAPQPPAPERPIAAGALRDPLALAIARVARRAPGALGESLVLPWAVAAPVLVADLLDAAVPQHGSRAEELSARLTTGAWGPAADEAATVLAELRGADPAGALQRIAGLPGPDPALAREAVAAYAARRADLATSSLGRLGIDRWEPFSTAVTMANSQPVRGVAASVGLGAGRLAWVPDARQASAFRPRDVLVAPRPLPQLAPLLWDAAAVVTLGGGPGAHLLESARALGIPAVTGVTAASLGPLPPEEELCLAVDGWTGDVYAVPW